MEDKDTYEYRIRCSNCKEKVTLTIPRGTTVDAYLEKAEYGGLVCSSCGCNPVGPEGY